MTGLDGANEGRKDGWNERMGWMEDGWDIFSFLSRTSKSAWRCWKAVKALP